MGGNLPAASYGTGGTVSSWTPQNTPRNVMFASYMQVDGTPLPVQRYVHLPQRSFLPGLGTGKLEETRLLGELPWRMLSTLYFLPRVNGLGT